MGPSSQRLCVIGALCLFWRTFLPQDQGTANPQGGMVLSPPVSSHPIPSGPSHAIPPVPCHAMPPLPSRLTSPYPSPSPSPAVGADLRPSAAMCSKAITPPRSKSSCLPWAALQVFRPSRAGAGSCWLCSLMGARQDQPNLKSTQAQRARPRLSTAARPPSIPVQPPSGEPSHRIRRGKPADELSLTCGLEPHWVVNFSISFMDLE